MERPVEQLTAILLEPGHLEDHQASPDGAAKGHSLVGLVKEVASRLGDPACEVRSGLQHGLTSSWPSIAS